MRNNVSSILIEFTLLNKYILLLSKLDTANSDLDIKGNKV